jgi:hypothetical protein
MNPILTVIRTEKIRWLSVLYIPFSEATPYKMFSYYEKEGAFLDVAAASLEPRLTTPGMRLK